MTTSTSAQQADTSVTKSILDLNSSKFDPEYYVQDLLQKKGLEELVAVEQDMVNNVRRLDSEMQSLVYENYSKFLNATSTVRDMQTRLVDTHNEMRDLSARVQRITDLSDNLTEKFAKNCEKVKKLNEAKNSVKRLEFLIKAPQILKNFIEQGQLMKAVDAYLAIRPKLEKFRDIPSIGGISKDVEEIIEGIKEQFYETLNGRLLSSEEVIEAATMLKKLDIPERELEKQLLANWGREMTSELEQLKENAKLENGRFPDIFEFVNIGCCHFLTNLSLMASTFLQLFPKQNSKMELVHLLEKLMDHFELILNERFELERNPAECALFVKALDRIYRKISVLTRLSSGFNFSRMNSEIVQRFAKHQIKVCRQSTLETIEKTIEEVVLSRLNHSPPAQSSSKSDNGRSAPTTAFSKGIRQDRKELLRKSLEKLESGFVHSVKSSLAALLMFTASDIIFPTIPHFSPLFGFDVHQQIVVGSMKDLVAQIQKRAKTSKLEGEKGQEGANGVEILVLCTFLRNLQLKHLDYLMELCREQYKLSEFHFAEQNKLTEGNELAEEMKGEVEILLRKFVQMQSGALIQMVRKSIDLFEWAATSESPRKVRNLIRHLVHSVEEIDADLAVFMDDGGLAKTKEHKQRTPDSLHSFPTIRRAASGASSISLSSGGIVERLWADSDPMEENNLGESAAVETAATIPVEFRRDVIVNGIVRLMLRAMCEFTRDQSFSVEGLEQMQVDCAFMRQKLWASVGDEHMLNTLIEDVLTAAVNQCAHPKLLDPSVLRSICEEN